ncbi:MAG TPA: BatD family protein [Kofleriaceae bacterium]|jgi:tetratricopeptide (TPR) repeat protein|nr:BatD family protein [Kofleriaceae bacterium]
MKRLVVIALVCLAGIAYADEPQARFSLERGSQPHAGMPFKLILAAGGFDQSPAPEQPKLNIANATVTPLGASPNVSQSIEIINGRQSVTSSVTWIFSYRIEAANPGRLQIPATTIAQGGKHATAQGATLDLQVVPATDNMKLELHLPDRPVFVGETVEVDLVWLFRSQPEDWTFALAMAQLPELTVSAPPVTDRRKVIEVASATKTLDLPFTMDDTDINGQKWGRATIKMFVAPHQAGKLTIPATQVTASLASGPRDFFGNADTQLFRAADLARTLEVKPLPETDKPAGFAGAVGSSFSIAVGTTRSVVQLGEPLELTITVKSAERLDALALPKLDGPGMLPADKFSVPADAPTGDLSDDGLTKTFKVSAVITAPTTEIPALALAYFDPIKGTYQTIHSEPIALSVAGSVVVGAGDVVSSAPKHAAPVGDAIDLAQVPVELALSAPGAESQQPLGGGVLWLLVGLLYAVPLAIFIIRTWQLRTQDQRDEAAEIRAARKQLDAELDRAAKAPARETAGPLAAAMRALARVTEREPDRELLARLETESFAPSASSSPLPSELVAKVREANEPRRASKRPATATVLVLFGIALAAPRIAGADSLADGRTAYQKAMTVADASARKVAFEQAETLLGAAAQAQPDRPELLADWGNAALGAGDMGTAVLAYRRALAVDPSNARAQHNLAWLRGRVPDTLRPTATAGAADALLFFHDWPRSRQWLVGGLAFALVVLLLVPWRGSRRRGLAMLAILPGIVWIAMTASAVTDDRHADDAVVTDSVVLRAADSAGAPAALPQALPRGAEVTVIEQRSPWTKVRVASGTAGWIPDGAIQRVH